MANWVLRIAAANILTLCLAGCAAGWRRPISDAVVMSRQLSIRGLEAQGHNDWSQAELLYQQAILQCPTNEQARRNFANSLWRRGETRDALAQMVKAVRLSGGDPEMTVELGRMYLTLGAVDPAAELADKAISADRHRADAWALRGDVRHIRGDTAEALASYHRALTYQPEFPEVQIATADVYQSIGKPRRALSTLDSLVDQYANGSVPTDVLVRRGNVLADLGRFGESSETLLAAAKRGDSRPELWNRIGEVQLAAGDPAAARLAFSETLRIAPHDIYAQQQLARLTEGPTRIALETNSSRMR